MTPADPAITQDSLLRRFDPDSRAYVVARCLLLGALAVLFALGIIGENGARVSNLYLGGLGILLIDTAVLFFLVLGTRSTTERAMMAILVPDLIAVGIFSYIGAAIGAFYAVVLLLPILYALVVGRNDAWLVAIGTTTAYVAAILFAGPLDTPRAAVLVARAAVVPMVAGLVANAVDKRRSRERAADMAAAESEHLNEQLRRRVYELQAISEITEIIHSSLDFDSVGPEVLDIVADAIGVKSCCLFVIDKVNSETLFSASKGTSALITDVPNAIPFSDSGDHLTCVPVFDHGTTMVMFCTTAEDLAELTDEDRLVLGAVASELVVAVENSRLYKLTSRLAITDELTGLANYRHLQARLDEEIARAKRYGKPLSLLMIDADEFKQFNDSQGHVAGDVALAELGPIMTSVVREVDLVARYGGEEFSVLLPETDAAGAFVVGEKIREAIELHDFADAEGGRRCHLTVSVGFATYPTHGADKDSVLREADDALYHAKNGGRNRVRSPKAARASAAEPASPAEQPLQPDDDRTGA